MRGRSQLEAGWRVLVVMAGCLVSALAVWAQPAGATPAWLAPVDLSAPSQSYQFSPRIALDAGGDSIAVWIRWEASSETSTVEAASRPAGGAWQRPVELSPGGQQAYGARIATDARGDAVVVWEQSAGNGSPQLVESASRSAGGAWQEPVTIPGAQGVLNLGVAVGSQGDAVAFWSSGNVVQASSRPAGGAWQTATNLSAPGEQALSPQVAVDPEGAAVAVWEAGGFGGYVQGAVRPARGAWQAPVTITGRGASSPHVAIDADGEAIAVWDAQTETGAYVEGAALPAGGAWQPPVQLSVPGKVAAFSQVVVDAQGDATAVWFEETAGAMLGGGGYVVQSAQRPAHGAWQAPVELSAPAGEQGGRVLSSPPQPASDPRGDAVVVWALSNGSHYVVRGAARPAGGAWQAAIDLSPVAGDAGNPQVAVDSQGNAAAVWDGAEGEGDLVQASGYDSAGPLLNSLSMPTTGIVGQPLGFSVSPLDVWSPLGATDWSFDDGTTASTESVSHIFTTPGVHEVTVQSADVLDNITSTSRGVLILPVVTASKPRTALTSSPAISAARLTHTRFRVERRSTAVSASGHSRAPFGTSFRLTLSAPAKLTIVISRVVAGQRRGGRCLALRPGVPHRRALDCARMLTVGTLTRASERMGADSVAFTGRIGRRALRAGTYRAVLLASNGGGRSKPVILAFTILR